MGGNCFQNLDVNRLGANSLPGVMVFIIFVANYNSEPEMHQHPSSMLVVSLLFLPSLFL